MLHTIIDVREPAEYSEGHAAGAINIPLSTMPDNTAALNTLAKDAKIVVYCRSGARASAAESALQTLGFTNVINGISQDQVTATYGLV